MKYFYMRRRAGHASKVDIIPLILILATCCIPLLFTVLCETHN
jgi:hypothetical protein